MSFRIVEQQLVNIKIVGVGGGGGNAVNTMLRNQLAGVECIIADTRDLALAGSLAKKTIQLGPEITGGAGAGADPSVGRESALESRDVLKIAVQGADMIFLTAGLGGGTGSGATPLIAEISRATGALTVAVVTKPFFFEGKKRRLNAEKSLAKIRKYADSTLIIPNDKLIALMKKNSTLVEMLQMADSILYQAVQSIIELVNKTGQINVDFADLKTVMKKSGTAVIGIGAASGKNRAIKAAQQAIDTHLLEGTGIDGAKALLVNFSAAENSFTLTEFRDAIDLIQGKVDSKANVIVGTVYDDALGDEVRVTVIATGVMTNNEG